MYCILYFGMVRLPVPICMWRSFFSYTYHSLLCTLSHTIYSSTIVVLLSFFLVLYTYNHRTGIKFRLTICAQRYHAVSKQRKCKRGEPAEGYCTTQYKLPLSESRKQYGNSLYNCYHSVICNATLKMLFDIVPCSASGFCYVASTCNSLCTSQYFYILPHARSGPGKVILLISEATLLCPDILQAVNILLSSQPGAALLCFSQHQAWSLVIEHLITTDT